MKNYLLKSIKVQVRWRENDDYMSKMVNQDEQDELRDIRYAFQISIKRYIKTFNSLPPIGFWIDANGYQEQKIVGATYDGIKNLYWVMLAYEARLVNHFKQKIFLR